jgi:hypothetical protein
LIIGRKINIQNVKKIISLLLLMFLILCLADCRKDTNGIDHSNWNYIYAGDYSDAVVNQLNDTLNTTDNYGIHYSAILDINHDLKPDLEITSDYFWFAGQTRDHNKALIKTFENCEIIVDSTVISIKKTSEIFYDSGAMDRDTTYFDSLLIAPKALDANYKINKDDCWYNCRNEIPFSFCYDFFVAAGQGVHYESVNHTFYGWSVLNDKYLGFRILSAKDTLYGFIKMNVRGFKWINLENSAYR